MHAGFLSRGRCGRLIGWLGLLAAFVGPAADAAPPHLARVAAAVAEQAARQQPVEVLIVLDDAVEQAQLRSAVGPLGAPGRMKRADYEHLLGTRRALLTALKSDVLLSAADPDVELLTDYGQLPVLHARIRSARALENLRRQRRIQSIDAIVTVRPTLAQSLPLIGQPALQTAGHVGTGTTVAVLDTGVDYTRAAFGSCISPGPSCRVVHAQDFAIPDGVVDAGNFHGTNVAGIVLGVAPGAKIAALDVFESNGQASSNVLLNAINWCIANRATYNIVAINMSLGGGRHYAALAPSDAMGIAIGNAINAGIAVVVASGNDGYTDSIAWPAAYANALSIGAYYDAGGTVNQITSFSNSASFLTMVAPGSMITAAGITMQGTSQATPHVAGAVAVLKAEYPDDTVAQTIHRLKLGANIIDIRNGVAKPRLDLQAATAVPPSSYRLSVARTGSGTVVASAGGIDCGSACTADIDTGSSVTLTALHGPQALFTGWSGACSGAAVQCTLTMSAARSVTAGFAANTGEDFLAGGELPAGWSQPGGSNAAWAAATATTYVGGYSLKAGSVAHGQKSEISFSGRFRAGSVSFARRVSSEAGQDLLRFYIDDQLQGSWSGEVAWGMVAYPVSAGDRVLKWVYEKNGAGSAGSDTAWIDSVNLPLAASSAAESARDFDGDGRADIVWRHVGNGSNSLWFMNGPLRQSGSGALPAVTDFNWRLVARADFNGDGKADLWWRHAVDGRNTVWLMDGSARLEGSGAAPTLADTAWQVAGTGDFDGDGKADVLWRHAVTGNNSIWFMDGSTRAAGSGATAALADANWRVMGVADFDGDGKADVLWRHLGNGSNALWFMDGSTRAAGSGQTTALADLNWKLVGAADFDGDGNADLLWRHAGDGRNALWLMDGLTRRSVTQLNAIADGNWRVVGLGDFNADGRADILWRNGATGQNTLWLMDGTTRLGSTALQAVTDLNWRVASPTANGY
jgi:subtilisin family serine protease